MNEQLPPPTTETAATEKKLPPLLKMALEMGPLVIFLIANQRSGILNATGIFIVATLVALVIHYLIARRLPFMPVVSGIVIVVFGGLTIYLHDETFIKLKPTIVNILLGLMLLLGLLFKKPILEMMLEGVLKLKEEGWRILTFRWALFFFALAAINELVWRTQSTDFWLKFKVFGFAPITVVFMLTQSSLIKRYSIEEPEAASSIPPGKD